MTMTNKIRGVNNTDINVLGPWVWKATGATVWTPVGKSAMGYVDSNGNIKWAVVFDNYHEGGSIHIHTAVADRKYVTRRAIQAVFEYPFIQLGVKKLIGIVNSENAAALSLDLRLGFQIETVIKDAYERGDMYILSMTPEQCRWIRGIANGNCEQRTAAA